MKLKKMKFYHFVKEPLSNRILADMINNIQLLKHRISLVESQNWMKIVSNKAKNKKNNKYILQVNFLKRDCLFKREKTIDHIFINVKTLSQKKINR